MAAHPALNSQAALGRAAKVDQKTVGRILNRTNEPSLEVIAKIAKVFDLDPWMLLVPNVAVGRQQAPSLVSAKQAGIGSTISDLGAQLSALSPLARASIAPLIARVVENPDMAAEAARTADAIARS